MKNIELLKDKFVQAVDHDDYDNVMDLVIDLITEEYLDKTTRSETMFFILLNALDRCLYAEKKSGRIIVNKLLFMAEDLSSLNLNKLRKYISENYGYFVDNMTSFSLAEWIGGYRDEWAINTIDKWLNESTHSVPLNNLGVALFEFLDSDLPYHASAELQMRAKKLKEKL